MSLINWVIFAVILGVVATLIDHSPKNGGFVGGIILSLTGTLLALFIAQLVFSLPSTLSITSLLIALYGAVMFLLTGRGLRRL